MSVNKALFPLFCTLAMTQSAFAAQRPQPRPDFGTVQLHEIRVDGDRVEVTYSKDFVSCAFLKAGSEYVRVSNINFCASGEFVKVVGSIYDFPNQLVPGTSAVLVHGGMDFIQSEPVAIGGEGTSVKLHMVRINGYQVEVVYSKNFETCAHLRTDDAIATTHNFFCETGRFIKRTLKLSDFTMPLYNGMSAYMVHGNGRSEPSPSIDISEIVIDPTPRPN